MKQSTLISNSDFTRRALLAFSSGKNELTAREFAERIWSDREIERKQVWAARQQLLRLRKAGLIERRRLYWGGRTQKPHYYLTPIGIEELEKITTPQESHQED